MTIVNGPPPTLIAPWHRPQPIRNCSATPLPRAWSFVPRFLSFHCATIIFRRAKFDMMPPREPELSTHHHDAYKLQSNNCFQRQKNLKQGEFSGAAFGLLSDFSLINAGLLMRHRMPCTPFIFPAEIVISSSSSRQRFYVLQTSGGSLKRRHSFPAFACCRGGTS